MGLGFQTIIATINAFQAFEYVYVLTRGANGEPTMRSTCLDRSSCGWEHSFQRRLSSRAVETRRTHGATQQRLIPLQFGWSSLTIVQVADWPRASVIWLPVRLNLSWGGPPPSGNVSGAENGVVSNRVASGSR